MKGSAEIVAVTCENVAACERDVQQRATTPAGPNRPGEKPQALNNERAPHSVHHHRTRISRSSLCSLVAVYVAPP